MAKKSFFMLGHAFFQKGPNTLKMALKAIHLKNHTQNKKKNKKKEKIMLKSFTY